MALAIGLIVLMAVLFSSLFRIGAGIDLHVEDPVLRRPDAEFDPERLDLARLTRDMAAACRKPDALTLAEPDSAAEVREADLCRQLLDGTMPAASYRLLMSELTHDAAHSSGAR